jgi:hypothetical protein
MTDTGVVINLNEVANGQDADDKDDVRSFLIRLKRIYNF